MKNKLLVTGGAGFIGSHIVDAIVARGGEAVVLDDFSTGAKSNLDGALASGRVTVVDGCITKPEDVARAFEGVDGVIHLAALPSVVRSVEEPVESNRINIDGGVCVFDEARRRGVKVVYAGSSSAYGDQEVEIKHEGLRESPLSPYAASKLACELYCRAFANVYDLPVVVTRFFNVFGPRQVPDSPYSGVVAAFCFAVLRNKAPRIDGDGSQSRDFTYVADVARGVLAAMDADTKGCQTVNLACGGSHSVKRLLDVLQEYAGTTLEPEFAPTRNGDVMTSQADVSKIRELCGFEWEVSFEEGLQKTFDWYRETYSS